MAIDTNHKKLIMCIIGGIIFHFGIGSIFPLGTFSIYILSYHIHTENWLTVDYGYFFTPVITLFLTISASIGGYLEAKVGVHK